MVEISMSGSGEGSGLVRGRGYSTTNPPGSTSRRVPAPWGARTGVYPEPNDYVLRVSDRHGGNRHPP